MEHPGKNLLTEDDTFMALRRIPFLEMRNLVIAKNNTNIPEEQYLGVMADLLESNHWTIDEYDKALERHRRINPQ